MTGSLAYRKNEAAILRGDVPEKYTRLLPFIPGGKVLELGSAEGVLALVMANAGRHVTALETNIERHQSALRLRDAWLKSGLLSPTAKMEHVNGCAQDAVGVIDDGMFDTLVAVRMIYYLRGDIDPVFAAIAQKIPNVVLCGNGNRAAQWRQGIPDKDGGPVNYYASHEGMRALLERHGYAVVAEERDGDPIVVGRR